VLGDLEADGEVDGLACRQGPPAKIDGDESICGDREIVAVDPRPVDPGHLDAVPYELGQPLARAAANVEDGRRREALQQQGHDR
jgi:hypothetical protein